MSSVDLPPSWRGRALVVETIDGPLEEWFTPEELEIADAFGREKRRAEWLLSRYAVKRLAGQPAVRVTRPQLADGRFISISHSHGVAAAAIGMTPVGIDIERVRTLDEHVAKHFLTESEIAAMQACTLPHRVLHWWCAKEASWKEQEGEIRFLRQIPLRLEGERTDSLAFENVETLATGGYVLALTR